MKRIVLYIDKLVLRGIDRADAKAVSVGIKTELQRLLAEPGASTPLAEGGDRYRIKAGTVNVAPAVGGRAMGQSIAGSIAKGLKS